MIPGQVTSGQCRGLNGQPEMYIYIYIYIIIFFFFFWGGGGAGSLLGLESAITIPAPVSWTRNP